jgi:hypothetical protein
MKQGMRFRLICEVVESSGEAPVSKWLGQNMNPSERAKLHVRFNRIEKDQLLPKEWLKPYKSLKMIELKYDLMQRAFRFLCHERGRQVILCGAEAKKGQISGTVENQASSRRDAIKKEEIGVRAYYLAERPSVDLDEFLQ